MWPICGGIACSFQPLPSLLPPSAHALQLCRVTRDRKHSGVGILPTLHHDEVKISVRN